LTYSTGGSLRARVAHVRAKGKEQQQCGMGRGSDGDQAVSDRRYLRNAHARAKVGRKLPRRPLSKVDVPFELTIGPQDC
jgi:hypothetical protein